MAHGDAWEGKWRGNWRMEWVASTLHTTSEHGVSSITTADLHTSAASSRLNWLPCRFKWTRPFHRKTKSGFCACAITFQMQSTVFLYTASESWVPVTGLIVPKKNKFWWKWWNLLLYQPFQFELYDDNLLWIILINGYGKLHDKMQSVVWGLKF